MKYSVLVVYYEVSKNDRNTINEHLYSFKKYSEHEYLYLNAYEPVPPFLSLFKFDVVIYHYTFLSQKWNGRRHFEKLLKKCSVFKKLSGCKIAMPQDEYVHSNLLCEFIQNFNVEVLFTCLEESEWEKVYPVNQTKLKAYKTVLTGYVDERMLEKLDSFIRPHSSREIDIGYRARKLPYWLGKHGAIKWRLTELFQSKTISTGLSVDLSNDEADVFKGNAWYEFLSNSRIVLGCEGGASLHDRDGAIRHQVDEYTSSYPEATFEEVEEKCFPGIDGNLKLFALSPRHFESCMTKTCQVLVEGEYFGIFKAGVHYIELKKDFSNISEVIDRISNVTYCETIAENAYRDIAQNSSYTYKSFVDETFQFVEDSKLLKPRLNQDQGFNEKLVTNYIKISLFLFKVGLLILRVPRFIIGYTKYVLFPVFKRLGLLPYYYNLRDKFK